MTDELTAQINKWPSLDEDNKLNISDKNLDQLNVSLFEITMKSYLSGRFEMFKRNEKELLQNGLKEWGENHFALADPVSVVFDLPFDKAVSYFENLMPIDKETFSKLSKEIRHKYFVVSRIEGTDIINKIKDNTSRAIKEGKTLLEFKDGLNDMWATMGITSVADWNTALVYNQNVSTAYHAGHFDQMFDPDVDDNFPYLEYSATMDNTRPAHAEMDGTIARKDDPVWQSWYPPNGFNCHCSVIPVSIFEAEDRGIKTTKVPKVTPDKGFAINPSKAFREVPKAA